jgi:hypothetical protein
MLSQLSSSSAPATGKTLAPNRQQHSNACWAAAVLLLLLLLPVMLLLLCLAHQHAVEMAMPSKRQSTITADRMVSRECHRLSPYLQQQQAGHIIKFQASAWKALKSMTISSLSCTGCNKATSNASTL